MAIKRNQLRVKPHPLYNVRLSEIVAKYPRVSEIAAGAAIYLSRKPEDGTIDPETGVRLARLMPQASCPPLLIYYTFDDRFLKLLTIMVGEDG